WQLRPVSERMKYYLRGGSKRRFVKHTTPFTWLGSWPKHRFLDDHREIRVAQYQYRDPEQILRRLETRRKLHATDGKIFSHEVERDDTTSNIGLIASNPSTHIRLVKTHSLSISSGTSPAT